MGDVIGRELRSLGCNHFGGVCMDLLRHPAWGRAQETYGEDTHHLGAFGAALTRGVQRHIMACAKRTRSTPWKMAGSRGCCGRPTRPARGLLAHFKKAVDAGIVSES